MTPAARAKKIREMADSVSVRNHLFTMVNTGRIDKGQRARALKFLDYIDGEVLKTCLEILPDDTKAAEPAHNSDFVQAREKKQAERAATTKKSEEAAKKEKHSKGVFSRAQ
ncbi:MAG: hypothetical protein CMB80_33340 [Flammeovirgaceae bacterium]|nr:hypothetical protein [Flammeovirgaceae bacterium]